MKRRSTLGIALIGVLFFTACKREDSMNIDQQRIYANYEYVYNSEKNTSTMMATFRVDNSGGTKIELSYPARVEFNGEGLTWRNVSGRYELSRSGSQIGGTFRYHDNDENSFANEVPPVYGAELPFGLTNISQSGNFFLPWQGAALQAGETIRVTISGGAQTSSKSWTVHTVGSSHIILDQNRLMDLTVGTAEIQLERETFQQFATINACRGTHDIKIPQHKVLYQYCELKLKCHCLLRAVAFFRKLL